MQQLTDTQINIIRVALLEMLENKAESTSELRNEINLLQSLLFDPIKIYVDPCFPIEMYIDRP
jgi:hypothetical protein